MQTLVYVLCDPVEGEPFIAGKIATVPYGSEGRVPADPQACPYFLAYGAASSCVSGSGGSMCGGFMGGTPGYVYCIWGLWESEAPYV